ncbi:protein of unknown function [Rhodovastum atsumiense]|nr:protein of unknown function [Rhodovastum atsumiense]
MDRVTVIVRVPASTVKIILSILKYFHRMMKISMNSIYITSSKYMTCPIRFMLCYFRIADP